MTRLSVSLPDSLAEQVRAAAGDNLSAWLADAARDKVLHEECRALAAWERANQDESWDSERWGE